MASNSDISTLPAILASSSTIIACLINILITGFWKERRSLLGKMFFMLNFADLSWAMTHAIYICKTSCCISCGCSPSEMPKYAILLVSLYWFGSSLAWSCCLGDVLHRINKYGECNNNSLFWKYTLVCNLVAIILATGYSYLSFGIEKISMASRFYVVAIILACIIFSIWKYIATIRLRSNQGTRWKLLIYPAITIVCNIPLCVLISFKLEISDQKRQIFESLWLLQGFFNGSLGIYTAIRYICSKKFKDEGSTVSLLSNNYTVNNSTLKDGSSIPEDSEAPRRSYTSPL